jgi:hypothetical protein
VQGAKIKNEEDCSLGQMGMIRSIHETIQSLKENMDAGRLNLPQQISELHQQRFWEAPSSALKEGFQQTL